MIYRKIDDRTHVFLDDDCETEIARIILPPGGVTLVELQRFMEHLERKAKAEEHGAS